MLNFQSYNNITKLTVPSNVKTDASFYKRCENMTELQVAEVNSLSIRDMVNAYSFCTNLREATVPDNVENLWCAFWGCTSLVNAVCGNSVKDMFGAYG